MFWVQCRALCRARCRISQHSTQPSHCAAWLSLSSTYLSFLQYIDTSLESHVPKVFQLPWIHSASLRVSLRYSNQPTLSSQYVVITVQASRGLLGRSRRSWRSSEAFVMFSKISETFRNDADPAAQSRLPTLQLLCDCRLRSGPLNNCLDEINRIKTKLSPPGWSGKDVSKRQALIQGLGWPLKKQDTWRSLETNITLTLSLQMFTPSTSIFSKTTY